MNGAYGHDHIAIGGSGGGNQPITRDSTSGHASHVSFLVTRRGLGGVRGGYGGGGGGAMERARAS
jgi:hypothetical protein